MAPIRRHQSSSFNKSFVNHKNASSATSSRKITSSSSRKSTHCSTALKLSKPVRPSKAEKAQKPIFRGMTLSIAGTVLDTAGNPISHESMAKWWILHGGEFEREVTADTTHLICAVDEYKRSSIQVQKAWKYNTKEHQCHIVVFEWLEDSLLGPKGQKKKRNEKGYTLDRTIARLRKGKTDHAEFRKKFEDGLRASKELCDNKLHKVYFDNDGFEYKIMLTRIDLSNEKPKVEKYTLFLFESIAKPHTYMVGAKLSRSHRPTSYYRDECHPKTFPAAFRDFQHFFFDKTQIAWEDRLEGYKRPGAFVYVPPILGRPVGWVPNGKGKTREWTEHRKIRIDARIKDDVEDVAYDTDSDVDDEDASNSGDDSKKSGSTTDSSSTSSSTADSSSSDPEEYSPAHAISYREPIPQVSEGYGYQPNVVDLRFQPSPRDISCARTVS